MDRSWLLKQASSILGRLFHIMTKNQKFSKGCQATEAPIKGKPIWIKGETEALPSHFHVYSMHVNQGSELEKIRHAFEMRCYRRDYRTFCAKTINQ